MTFWSHNRWKSLSEDEFPVSPRIDSHIKEAECRLSVGSEVFIPDSKSSSVQKLSPKESFSIKPGQFAFILTEETLSLSNKVLGLISVRATIKFAGLVNVSGFHVDPGYCGKLIFAVFNSGPKRITIQRGDPIFSLWISDLDEEVPASELPKPGYQHIPASVINGIDGNHLTAYQLSEKIDQMEDFFKTVKIWAAIIAFFLTVFFAPSIISAFGSTLQTWKNLLGIHEQVQKTYDKENPAAETSKETALKPAAK